MKIAEIMPLTPLQEGLLYASTLSDAGPDPYTVQADLGIEGDLDPRLLRRSTQAVLDRHPNLRTAFRRRKNGMPVALVLDGAEVGWTEHDLTALPPDVAHGRWCELRAADRDNRFDPGTPPLLRLTVARLSARSWRVLITNHHLILDGWSSPLLVREIFAAYAAGGSADGLPAVRSYRDFLEWLGKRDSAAALDRWRQVLGPTPSATLIAPDTAQVLGSRPAELRIDDLGDVTDRLTARARTAGTTAAALVQTAWGLTLGLDTGRGDVLFGTTVSGRSPEFEGAESIIGMTLGAVPVRVEARAADSLIEVALRVQAAQTTVMDDHWVGLPAISGAVGLGEMFDTLLVFENHPLSAGPLQDTIASAGLTITTIEPQDSTHYPLTLQVIPNPEMQIRLHYLPEVVSADRRDRLVRTLVTVLAALADAPDTPVAALPVLDDTELEHIRALGTGPTLVPTELDALLSITPGDRTGSPGVAVTCAGHSITFAELDARADTLSARLRRCGIGPESIVALSLPRQADTVAAVLAILRAGAAILPVALDYPTDFITFILDDAAPDLLIVDGSTPVPGSNGLRQLIIDTPEADPVRDPLTTKEPHPDNLAYLLYTSGSTGIPKSVAGTRAGLAARLTWARELWPPTDPDVRLVKSSLSFIDGLTELLGAVAAQSPMILATDDERVDPIAQAGLIDDHAVTQVTAVGSLAAELAASAPRACARIIRWILSGETLSADITGRLLELAPRATIVNSYGSSEVVGDVTFAAVDAATADPVPIGRPVPGTEILVLDAALRPTPVGVVGEIYVASTQLARGYPRRPGLTAERFVANPFGTGRLFRTGDIGCWDSNGDLEFHGRGDGQVKIRGHRVETVGVEAALRTLPGVDTAVVVARPDPTGSLTLWAYVTGDGGPDPAALRSGLAERLPDYQIPAVVVLDELPTLPNGKVDRRSLPDPATLTATAGSRPPATGTESTIAALYGELLGLADIDADLNFFAAGGHSLLATRLTHRLTLELDAPASVRTVFDHPTVAALAAWVDGRADAPHPTAGADAGPGDEPRPDPLPASPAQRRLWALDRLQRDLSAMHAETDFEGSAYNLAFVVELDGHLDVDALRAAAQSLVDRHESLRTQLVVDDGGALFQQILPAGTPVPSTEHTGPGSVAAMEFSRSSPFDLAEDVPIRIDLAHTGDATTILQVVMHHIAGDEWSTPLVFDELATGYENAISHAAPLPAPAIQYADAALRQDRQLDATDASGTSLRQREREHWRDVLDGLPDELPLPYDRPRPAIPSDSGGTVEFSIDAKTADALGRLTRATGVTGFMVAHAAVVALWSRLTGSDDIPLGTPVAGRDHSATQSVIGMFTNTVVLRARVTGDPTVAELLDHVKQVDLSALDHQSLPFQEVVDAVDPARDVARSPLFQTMVQYRSPISTPDFAGLTARIVPIPATTAKFDLTVEFLENGPGQPLSGRIEFSRDLFDDATVTRIADALTAMLTAMVADPGIRLSRLPLLTDPDRAALHAFNDTATQVRTDVDLPGLIWEAAAAHPGTPAVVDETTALSYSELICAADTLAERLLGAGVGTDDVVGVDVPRGIALSVSVLAIMRAGAAYLPLDRDHPPARRDFILADAGPAAIVTDDGASIIDGATPVVVVVVDAVGTPTEPGPTGILPLAGALPAERGAYLIYTSGSTGKPKSVVVDHPAIVNRLEWMQDRFGLRPGERVLHKTPIGFDVSVWELFWPLICGATIVMATPGAHREPVAIAETLARQRITTAHFVPSLLRAFLAETSDALPDLRRILCSGEALTAPLRDGVAARFPHVRLHNLYGPTEAAVDVTEIDVTDLDGPVMPIGAPVWNTGLHVLGRTLDELPIGVWGELYLSGRQLARGYAGRPGLTAGRFVACPFGAGGERMYRTGDIARWTDDGVLEYAGRSDSQLKLRGQRIEPGEIEQALLSAGGLAQAVVVGHTTADGRTMLVAYGVPMSPEDIAPEQILLSVALTLPAHLVPATLTLLDALPVTTNGKLDARRLPDPVIAGVGGTVDDPVAADIADVFAEVLHRDQGSVGAGDDFFALGGDSIVAITVVNRLRRRGLLVDVRELFEQRTVAALAAVVRRAEETDAPEVSTGDPERTDPLPLTPIVAQLASRPGRWQSLAQSITVALPAAITADEVRQALAAVISRHEALRLRVTTTVAGVWTVQPIPSESFDTAGILTVHEITDATEEAFASVAAGTHARLDPTVGGTITAAAVFESGNNATDTGYGRLVLVIHHLAVDAVSWRILLDDLAEAANAVAAGATPALPPPAVSYSRYTDTAAELAAAPSIMAELTRWQGLLTRSAPITDAATLGVQADLAKEVITLDAEQTRAYLTSGSVTAALIADTGTAITRWLPHRGNPVEAGPLLIDVEGHGRDLGGLDLSRTVGWLTTVGPVLFDPAADDPVDDIASALGQESHSYGLLRYCNARTARVLARAPKAQVLVNYLGTIVLGGQSVPGGQADWQPASEAAWTRTRPADDLGAEYAVTVDARVERDSRGQDRLVVEVTCSALVFTGPEIEALVRSVEATVCERAARSGRVCSGHVRS